MKKDKNNSAPLIEKKDRKKWCAFWLGVIVVTLCMKIFLCPVSVIGLSMSPTYRDGEVLFSNRFYKEITRNQIVTVKLPYETAKKYKIPRSLIKRVVAVPGDTIEIKDNRILVNGEEINKNADSTRGGILEDHKIILNDNEYFLIGDNINCSVDSRIFGPVSIDNIRSVIIKQK